MIDFTLSSNLIITGGPREEVGHCVESGLSVTLRAWQGQSLALLGSVCLQETRHGGQSPGRIEATTSLESRELLFREKRRDVTYERY